MASDARTNIALDDYLEDVKQLIISFYNSLRLRASGNFGTRLLVNNQQLIIPGYGRFIGDGTGVRTFPPLQPILEWMRAKGISPKEGRTDRQTAFLIARKISRVGTDIFQGAAGIPYEQIMERALDQNEDDIADAIFFDVLDSANFQKLPV